MKIKDIIKILFCTGAVLCFVIIIYNALYNPYRDEMQVKTSGIYLAENKSDENHNIPTETSVETSNQEELKTEIPKSNSKHSYNNINESQNNAVNSNTAQKRSVVISNPSNNNRPKNSSNTISYPFNLNTATMEQLCSIKGVGEMTAGKILAYRDDIGGFDSVERIMDIKGIGQATYERINAHVYCK